MPRDGSGIYTQPFPDVVPTTTIESAVYNGFVNDVETDLNAPRPIVAGGTGANNAHDARLALAAEAAMQIVTNYDTFSFEAGSFYSAPGTTAAPEGGDHYMGICYTSPGGAKFIEARAYSSSIQYLRRFTGAWEPWVMQPGSVADLDARYVNLTGDTMTGTLSVPSLNVPGASGAINVGQDVAFGMANATANLYFTAGGIRLSYNAGHFDFYGASLKVLDATASSAPTTGALTVAGGVGIGEKLNVYRTITGSAIYATAQLEQLVPNSFVTDISAGFSRLMSFGPDATTVGSIQCNLYSSNASALSQVFRATANNLDVQFTTPSSSPTTGALTVGGGLGVAGAIHTPTPAAGTNNTQVATTAFVAAAAGAKVARVQKFTASGTYTPHANMLFALIRGVGGGGGSGGCVGATSYFLGGGGGGGGGYTEKWVTKADVGASQAVTIGAAGAAGAAGGSGGAGGTTSVGALASAGGGAGGSQGTSGAVGVGGAGGGTATGDFASGGQNGANGFYSATGPIYCGGDGGASLMGFGGRGVAAGGGAAVGGQAGQGPGGGGAGAASNNQAGVNPTGSAGFRGEVWVIEYCSQ